MCELIKKYKQIDYELKREISFILQIMVFKYFEDSEKRKDLLGEINMKQYDSDLEMIAYEIYGEDIEEQKEIIKQQSADLKQKDNDLKQKDIDLKQKDNDLKQKDIDLKQKDNDLKQKDIDLKERNELLKEIKEKNNLDDETSAKIDAILSND